MDLTWKTITELARELRKNPTPAEKKLWTILRKRQLHGYKFLRQKPFVYNQRERKRYFYIADFYCAELKLVIEVDGKIHDYHRAHDYQRDLVLKGLGLHVLRILNEELGQPDNVIEKIKAYMPR